MKPIFVSLLLLFFALPHLYAQKPIAPQGIVVPYRAQYRCDGKWEKMAFQERKPQSRYSHKKVGWLCTRKQARR